MNRQLIAASLILLLGLVGCSSKATFGINRGQIQDTQSVIEKTIPDAERREALQAIVEAYRADMLKIEEESIELRKQIHELNCDFDAPREELEVRYDRLGELTRDFGNTAKKYSLQAKALCTEEEWKKIAPKNIDPFSFTL